MNEEKLAELRKERDDLQKQLLNIVKPIVINNAAHNQALFYIQLYTHNIRRLGYLNRIPRELGEYADSLEGLIRAENFHISQTLTEPQENVDNTYYWFLVSNKPRVPLGDCNKQAQYYKKLDKILYQKNIKILVKKWMRFIHTNMHLTSASPDNWLSRFFRKHFKKTKWTLEIVYYTRILARLLKDDMQFYTIIKKPLKKECREYQENIAVRIGEDYIVIPDVEYTEPSISDFISTTAVLRNIKRGVCAPADEIMCKMDLVGEKIRNEEAESTLPETS